MTEYTASLRTWCEIDLTAMLHNFLAARRHLPDDVLLAAVIKADAYGHGAVATAKLLEGKADRFAVAVADEAVELRKAGIQTPIFLLGPTPESDFAPMLACDIEAAVPSFDYGKALCAYGAAHGKAIPYHIVLDTGMGRIGFACTEQSLDEIEALSKLPGGQLLGMFSHYAKADSVDKTYANEQTKRFKSFTQALEQRGVTIPLKHISNSAGLIEMPDTFDMVREGIILYGLKRSGSFPDRRHPGGHGPPLPHQLSQDRRRTHAHQLRLHLCGPGRHAGGHGVRRVRRRGEPAPQQPGPGAPPRRPLSHPRPGVHGPVHDRRDECAGSEGGRRGHHLRPGRG